MRYQAAAINFVILAFLPVASALGGEVVKNLELGFQFALPDGFVEHPDEIGNGRTIHQYVDREPTPEDPAIVIKWERLRATFDPNERLNAARMERNTGIPTQIELLSWNDLTLDRIRQRVPAPDGGEVVTYVVQFPLTKEAVQFVVGGMIDHEPAIKRLFHEVFASVMTPAMVAAARDQGRSQRIAPTGLAVEPPIVATPKGPSSEPKDSSLRERTGESSLTTSGHQPAVMDEETYRLTNLFAGLTRLTITALIVLFVAKWGIKKLKSNTAKRGEAPYRINRDGRIS